MKKGSVLILLIDLAIMVGLVVFYWQLLPVGKKWNVIPLVVLFLISIMGKIIKFINNKY